MFRSVFDADYQGYEVFLDKVLKPLFGEQLEVLPVAEDNPTGVSEEAMEKARIKKIVRVANIAQTFNRDPMEVFDITLEDRVDITRARVGIQQIIRRGLFIHTHAFMLFHAEHPDGENWRFSYAHKLDTVGSMTDAKRYTYLFGENMHCRTAIDRFADLAKGEITNQKLLDAFNVEALSDEFFDEYRKHYAAFVKYITGKYFEKEGGKWVEKSGTPNEELMAQFGGDDKAVRDYVKKLMGRITFLHFLQKKGWMNWDVNYMQHLFEKSDKKDNFLEAVLEPLFFGVLNTKVQNRSALFEQRGWDFSLLDEWQDFPYLNGGLFEEDESDRLNVVFPESYFVDLFKFYARYNFTVDENDPDDAEVGVDPEMLGKIFENLLEDNKDKGAFYTPKEIVRYMCQESLTAYLVGKTGYNEDLIRSFVIHPYDEVEKFDNQQQNAIYNALENVKICDPAIGSGAFPMGLLNELVRCEEALLGEREDDHQSRSGLKKYIIQNNIYGVDIEKGAIDIARLRFWLSIVVDEKEPSPLPNLDYKIMQGNSLLESYKKIDLSHLLSEEGIGEDMLGGLFANQDVIQDTKEELAASLEAYFNCSDHEEKMRIQEDIRTIIKVQLSARNLNVDFGDIDVAANQEFFLWHTWFSDVFNRPSDCEKGFDIVIGNPPYIDSETMTKIMPDVRAEYARTFSTARGNWDIYIVFYEQGLNLLNSCGRLSFITPNKWLSIGYGKTLRKKVFDNIISVCDCQRIKVFEAGNEPTICFLSNNKVEQQSISVSRYETDNSHHVLQRIAKASLSSEDLGALLSEHIELLMKIKQQTNSVGDYIDSENPFSTAEAYDLIPLVHDAPFNAREEFKLINTGTIDPYISFWGIYKTAYLKGKYDRPVIDRMAFEKKFPRRKRQATATKIIISGMRYFEAFLDAEGEYIAGKSTIILLNAIKPEYYKILLGILNSKMISFYLKQSYSTLGIGGGINYSNDMVAAIPCPSLDGSHLARQIIQFVDIILSCRKNNPTAESLDSFPEYLRAIVEIEKIVSKLYGLSIDDVRTIDSDSTISAQDLE